MDEKDLIIHDIPVTVYGNLEKYNETISKGRCRIFYKGANRNGTFITDEFADKLLSTIAYAPVKGIFSDDEDDYTDHGKERHEGRIYGIVPVDYNLTWEPHVDEDGVERTYACVDVLIYTQLYSEANTIFGKSQSMELYRKSIKGDWQIIEGKRYYVYEDACFLGLQVLGDKVEPCFEGAAFFSLYQSLIDQVKELEQSKDNFQKDGQGGDTMENSTFKMSDDQKYNALWELLNAEGYYAVCSVYDDYAVAYDYQNGKYERVYYTKDDGTDSVTINNKETCYILDVTETEYNALKALRTLNGDSYELIDEKFSTIPQLEEKISETNTKVEELNNEISTLTTERDEKISAKELELTSANESYSALKAQYDELVASNKTLTSDYQALVAYKKNIEDAEKASIIDSYSDSLSVEVLEQFRTEQDQYTAEELDMRLTYAAKKAHPEVFQKQSQPAYVPKENEPKSGIEQVLSRYEKK